MRTLEEDKLPTYGRRIFFLSSSIRRISPLPYFFSLEQFSRRIREWKVKASITEAKLYASSKTDSSNGDSLNFTHPEPFAILQTEDIWGSEFRHRKKKEKDNVQRKSVAVTPEGMKTRSQVCIVQ